MKRPAVALFVALAIGAFASPLSAQRAKATKPAAPMSIVGTWVGSATVPLKDSTIVVPVSYTFTDGPSGMTGTAFVPGQGAGPISNIVRDSVSIRFRVTVTQGALEHEAKLGADGAIEGLVNMNNLPVAKFRITPKKP